MYYDTDDRVGCGLGVHLDMRFAVTDPHSVWEPEST